MDTYLPRTYLPIVETPATEHRRTSFRVDFQESAWRVGVGLGCGSLVGFLVGGPLARLLMFALRLTSPHGVRGVTSDDGFTIGVVSTDSLFLLLVCGGLGAVAGIVYACFRRAIRDRRIGIALWTMLCAAVAGAGLVHTDGVDFTLLEPTGLSVGGFIALPALTGLVIALLVERCSSITPGRNRATVAVLAPGLLAPPAILGAVGVALTLTIVGRMSGPGVRRAARLAVPVLTTVAIVVAVADIVNDVNVLTSP